MSSLACPGELKAWETGYQFTNGDATFKPGNIQSCTGMNTATECKMRVRVSFDVENIRMIKHYRVPVRRTDTKRQHSIRWYLDTVY